MKILTLSEIKRKTLLLLLIFLLVLFMPLNNIHAQKFLHSSVKISQSGNYPLLGVFDLIHKQTGARFMHSGSSVITKSNVYLKKQNSSIVDILDSVLPALGLKYKVEDENIFIYYKGNSVISQSTTNQLNENQVGEGNLTVIIVDSANLTPLNNVKITIQNSHSIYKLYSDINGMVHLNNLTSGIYGINITDSLYVPITENVNVEPNKNLITKFLLSVYAKSNLKDVIVYDGYSALSKERSTGSYGIITAKDISSVPTTNIMERLEGRVAGMDVNSVRTISTNKVQNNAITIRGNNSYQTSTVNATPLIVIDGVPYYQYRSEDILSTIDPESIQQITVLKDAAAASIWGAQASNGVIVVTTKKGGNQSTINFSSTTSVTSGVNLKKLHQMNSSQLIDYEKELISLGRIIDPKASSYKYYHNVTQAERILFDYNNGTITADEENSMLDSLSKINNLKQIKKYLLQSAVTQQYNLAFSGGTDKSKYFIAGYYAGDRPIYKDNINRTVNLIANNEFLAFKDRILIQSNISFNNMHDKVNSAALNATGNSMYGLNPYDLLKNPDGSNKQYYLAYTPEIINAAEASGYLKWTYSALDELNYSNSISNTSTIRGTLNIKGKVTNWMDLSFMGNYEKNIYEMSTYNELESYQSRDLINNGTTINSSGKLIYGIPNTGGNITTSNTNGYSYGLRGQIDIHKNWNNINSLNLVAGAEEREVYYKSSGQTLYGYDEELGTFVSVNPTDYYYKFTSPTYASGQIGATSTGITESTKRFLSYYTNGGYGLLNKYFLNGSVRFDDYNMLGVSRKKRAKPLWSAGVKWDIKKENLLKNVDWLDRLSLRSTYGFTGSLAPDATSVTIINTGSTSDYYTNQPYAYISIPANPELGWETTRQIDLGIDYSLLDNRLSGSIDYYQKRTSGIIASVPYNSTYGWTQLNFNTGKTKGHGFDITINGMPVKMRNFQWATSLTLAYTTNKVTDARFTSTTVSTLLGDGIPFNGYPTDYLMVYRWAGLDSTGQSQVYDADGKIVNSKTNLTDTKALKYVGRRGDPYFGGFFNTFTYKEFTLGINITYYFGGHFLRNSISTSNYTISTYSNSNFVPGKELDIASRWKVAGDETKTNVPGLKNVNSNSINRYMYSDLLVESSSHIRLKQISLSYNLPANVIKNTVIKGVQFSAIARDLGIIWRKNKDGIDPQYISDQSSINRIPPATNFMFKISANF
ncbi:MAG: SusC/RagA family TonB-linked outer membrane protein [Arachidicoccus sp.]|nr:SusC/RagA family TonB-linked outer membrane protein [Arachidicoccus sp.]